MSNDTFTRVITNTADAMAKLGITGDELSAEQIDQLDREGYLVIPNAISLELAQRMAARLDEIADEEGENAGKDFHTEAGVTRLGALMNKDTIFDVCFLDPRILAAVNHITGGDFGLSSLTGRAAQPGEGAQGLHVDFAPDPKLAVNAVWALDDFTAENGPTRIVPRSHLIGKSPNEVVDPEATHPDEIYFIVPAGSVAIVNGATWHAGTRNNTSKARHLLSAMFQPRARPQTWAYRRITPATRDRYNEAERFILMHDVAEE